MNEVRSKRGEWALRTCVSRICIYIYTYIYMSILFLITIYICIGGATL